MLLARGFNKSAITRGRTPPSRNTPVSPCRVVRPDNHLATISIGNCIGLDRSLRTKVGDRGILQIRVLALIVTAYPHRATTLLTRGIDRRLIGQRHPIAQHIDIAAFGACGSNRACALNVGVATGLQHHPAAFQRGSGRLNQAAVPERAGKNADCIAFERPQIDGLVGRRLHLQADAFETPAGQLNLPPRCQNRAAVGRLDQGIFSGIDGAAQQHHVAAARQNPALHRDARA